jgi:hypothetical protein
MHPLIASLLLAAVLLPAETVTVEPGQSLQEAVDKLRPGDTLLLAEGTFHQSIKMTSSGTEGNPITIKAKVPGKSVISGALQTPPVFERVEGAIYKTKWPSTTWKGNGTGQAWVMADDRSLYNFSDLDEMRTFLRSGGKETERTPQEGFFYQGEELYVRLLEDANPNTTKMGVSRPDLGPLLEVQGQQHIVLEGLRFQVAPAAAVLLGARGKSEVSKHIVIRDCYFSGCHNGIEGKGIREKDVNLGISDVTVEYCQFSNYPTFQWIRHGKLQLADVWGAVYSSVLGGVGIAPGRRASAWKIRNCYLHDCFDGIGSATSGVQDPTMDNEFAYNLLHNCGDDSIEFDSMEYMGLRVHNNFFLDGYCLLALSPVQGGGLTIDHNIAYVSPEGGMPWGVIFKFSTPDGSGWRLGGFHPLTGITIRNNTLIHTKCAFQWGASKGHDGSQNPYFTNNVVANNVLYARDWRSFGGFPAKLGLTAEMDNLFVGPFLVAAKGDLPEGLLSTRDTARLIRPPTTRWEIMPPLLPTLVREGETGEETVIDRVNFSVSEDFVRSVVATNGFAAAAYQDVGKNLGAVPPGTKWDFPRPGPRWADTRTPLFHPPFPPSLDPWWVGFADQPSEAKTATFKPWRGKGYAANVSPVQGAKVSAAGTLNGPPAEALLKKNMQTEFGPTYAVDGEVDTAWCWDSSEGGGAAWLEADLGRATPFNFIELLKVHRCNTVAVEVKRADKWVPLHTFDIRQRERYNYATNVPLTEARYVRITVTTTNTPGYLSDFRLFQRR